MSSEAVKPKFGPGHNQRFQEHYPSDRFHMASSYGGWLAVNGRTRSFVTGSASDGWGLVSGRFTLLQLISFV